MSQQLFSVLAFHTLLLCHYFVISQENLLQSCLMHIQGCYTLERPLDSLKYNHFIWTCNKDGRTGGHNLNHAWMLPQKIHGFWIYLIALMVTTSCTEVQYNYVVIGLCFDSVIRMQQVMSYNKIICNDSFNPTQ